MLNAVAIFSPNDSFDEAAMVEAPADGPARERSVTVPRFAHNMSHEAGIDGRIRGESAPGKTVAIGLDGRRDWRDSRGRSGMRSPDSRRLSRARVVPKHTRNLTTTSPESSRALEDY